MSPEQFARWQGEIDEFRRGVNGRFRRLEGDLSAVDKRQDNLDKELTTMRAKVAAGAAIGSIAGGALVTFIVGIATKAVGA